MTGFAVVPNWLLRDTAIGQHAKLLWAYLSSRAERSGVCFPSQDLIAEETGMSRATVQRALVQLRDLGLVTVLVETTASGRRNRYFLHNHQGGSHQGDATGRIRVMQEEEPVEEEVGNGCSPPPVIADATPSEEEETSGRMTNSWRPTIQAQAMVTRDMPQVSVNVETIAFRGWHVGQPPVSRTRTQWDGLFVSWCARKQTAWDSEHSHDSGVKFDEVTGMPVNPKKPQWKWADGSVHDHPESEKGNL